MVFKFSEDYSQILYVLNIGFIKDVEYYFKTQNKFLAIKTKSSYHIFDFENLKL
jgi:hypothetical protein